MASGTYANNVSGIPSREEGNFCMFSLFDINPAVNPVRAFPSGKPISPNHPPFPTGPNIIPGNIPARTPVNKPSAGPTKKPAMNTGINEKSNAMPGAIGPAK